MRPSKANRTLRPGICALSSATRLMKAIVVLLSIVVVFAACKRSIPSPPAPPSASAPQTVPEPAAKSVPVVAPTSGSPSGIVSGDQNLLMLNNALKAYMAKHKKAPAKLDDLAKEGLIPFVPFAPPGGRYELDAARGEVRFVNPMSK